jgi:hypothetical protein
LELHTLPVISTCHLTKEVSERLTNDAQNNPWCTCASWEHGFFLHLDDLESSETNGESMPQCLIDIRDWMRTKNLRSTHGDVTMRADWVRLDSAADTEDDLPSYDW